MNKKSKRLFQGLIFLIIFLGNLFLASRYYSRDDMLGTVLFGIVVILSGLGTIMYFKEWRRL